MLICQPCERTLVEVMTLLELLQKEQLSETAQAQARSVARSIKSTGEYLIGKKIEKLTLNGRAAYREI